MAHGQRRDREEVGAVLPGGLRRIHQLEIGLVDQSGGVQGLARTPHAELAVSDHLEFFVDQGKELVHGAVLAMAHRGEQLRDLS